MRFFEFKLQAPVNDPRRTQDLEDSRALPKANRPTLDMDQLQGYFRPHDVEPLIDDLLHELD